jgi:hypothetical protein
VRRVIEDFVASGTSAKHSRKRAERRQNARAVPPIPEAIDPYDALPKSLDRNDAAIAIAIFVFAFTIYAITCARTVYAGDAPEFATSGALWGVPHPPSYPFHTILLALFVRIVRIGSMAFRANLFSSFSGALASSLLYVAARRASAERLGALAAAISFSLGLTLWSQSIVAEVYALDAALQLASIAIVLWTVRTPTRRTFAYSGIILGLLVGHRVVNVIYLPGFFAVIEVARKRAKFAPNMLFFPIATMALTGLVYLYLPLAARTHPALNMNDPETMSRFWESVTASRYQHRLGEGSLVLERDRVLNFLGSLPKELGITLLAIPFGVVRLWKRMRWIAVALLWTFIVGTVFASKYNILDIAPYFIPAIAAAAVVGAVGFSSLPPRARIAMPVLALACLPWNFRANQLAHVNVVDHYLRDALAGLPENAVLLSNGDTADHGFLYMQSVEQLRPDVIHIREGLIDNWYDDELRRQHPNLIWPSDSELTTGKFMSTFVRSNMNAHPICMVDPPELRVPRWHDPQLLDGWNGIPDGLLFCLDPIGPENEDADKEKFARRLEKTRAFWKNAKAWSVEGDTDPQIVMTEFRYPLAHFTFAAALLRANDDPDGMESAMQEAYDHIDRHVPKLSLGERAERAKRLAPNADAMLHALADAHR